MSIANFKLISKRFISILLYSNIRIFLYSYILIEAQPFISILLYSNIMIWYGMVWYGIS